MSYATSTITVASRASPLARTQVQEVLAEIRKAHPNIEFSCIYQKTFGDIDRLTSLRSLDKTDFFTRELDRMLLANECRIAIHAAKDLPEPIPNGLEVIAITRGIDSSDVLVLRQGESLASLQSRALIATSSERREEAVKALWSDVSFVDVRGTIEERLQKLHDKTADGVVVAEAALIRLGLTHLNRIKLPGETTPLQGKLAVVCRTGDIEMIELFGCIDSRVVS
jgi:hydroxymethylbilane synthase